jgi:hypothetical protein
LIHRFIDTLKNVLALLQCVNEPVNQSRRVRRPIIPEPIAPQFAPPPVSAIITPPENLFRPNFVLRLKEEK